MAEQTVVRREAVVPIPDSLAFASACLLGCAAMTGYGSVANVARVAAGSSVCVIGCGGVGLNVVQSARVRGASRIIAVDTSPSRLESARRFGATDLVAADARDAGLREAARAVIGMTEGRGADYAFECTGIPALAASPLAFVRHGGVAVQVSGTETEIPVDMELFEWNKTYINPLYGGCVPARDYPTLFRLYDSGQFLLDELVGRTYPLDDLAVAIEDMLSGRHTKGVLLP
jgi:Zn-dependent alcohol dehydrogenase